MKKGSAPLKTVLLFAFVLNAFSLAAQKRDSIPAGVYYWNKVQGIKEATRLRKEVVEGSTLDLAYFEVHSSTLESGKAPHPPHTHVDTEELVIVKEGLINVTIKGKTRKLGAGSVALAMPGDEHGINNAATTNATYYILKLKSRSPMNGSRAAGAGGSFAVNWDTVAVQKTDRGERRNVFDKATSQFARLEMHATTLNAGQVSHAPHTHRAEESVLIKSGTVEMQIGDKFYPASAGDLVFLSSGILHALKNTGKMPCTYFAFQWMNE